MEILGPVAETKVPVTNTVALLLQLIWRCYNLICRLYGFGSIHLGVRCPSSRKMALMPLLQV